jgi:hypothetical protein
MLGIKEEGSFVLSAKVLLTAPAGNLRASRL